jgi:DNA repair exonuclease SbcCD ATPase subunit
VATFRGTTSEVYLENLAPAFYIDQDEGWTNVQALQIGRYGQQEIAEVSVEYLLGATDAIRARVARQQATQKNLALRETARTIAERVSAAFLRRGWRVDWSGHGSVSDTLARWSSRTLREALKQGADVDLSLQRVSLNERVERLRRALTSEPIDPANVSAPAAGSQRVIELKQHRHKLSEELHTLRTQHEQTAELVASLEHRIHAASDLLRVKTTGVGRLDHMECPTCHRDLDPETFALTEQSQDSISTHIQALKRDRELMSKNLQSLEASLTTTTSALTEIDVELRDAERALVTVTAAIGTVREQVAQIAADLTGAEKAIDRIVEVSFEIDELQDAINRWTADARTVAQVSVATVDLKRRRDAFLDALRKYLIALGHSAVRPDNEAFLDLDEQYVPYLSGRRLRSLGSASDQARLIAAYSLALTAASQQIGGLHPGIVILDEPLQQNPDPHHRELFLAFLSQELARQAKFQTIVFTALRDDEIAQLRRQGTNVVAPEGDHFLKLVPPASPADSESNTPESQSLDHTNE